MNKLRSLLSILLVAGFVFVLGGQVQAQSLQENMEPISNAGPDQTVATSSTVTLDGSASTDPDENLPLTYQWTQTGGTTVTLSDSTAVSPTFTAPAAAEVLTFELSVTDSLALTDSTPDVVQITVSCPPVADAGPDQVVTPSSAVTLDGSASADPDGNLPLTYQWTQTGGTTVILSDSRAVSPTFTAPAAAGVLTFELSVTDSLALTDSTPDEVQIFVTNPPVADAGSDQTVGTNSTVTLDGSASADPDGDLPLTYQWTQTGGSAVTLTGAASVNPTFTAPNAPGTLIFSLLVSDSLGMAALTPDTVTITVDYNYVYLPIIMTPFPPDPFTKSGPASGAINQSVTPTLSWGATSPLSHYEYCYDTSNDNACTGWINNGKSTSVTLPTLLDNTTYYWQVRAWNSPAGPTYANGSATAFWSFKTIPFPAAFSKFSPYNSATNQSITPLLSWTSTSPATYYEYCYDATNDNACTTWIPNGTSTSVTLPVLSISTTYYWQVRAWNGSGGPTYANGSASAFWSFTTTATPAWRQVLRENFEGTFPGNWDLISWQYISGSWYNVTNQISWGKNSCQKYAGSYSGRAVGGGSQGVGYPCGYGYPLGVETWMTYGPFDLTQVKDAYLALNVWVDTEYDHDGLIWVISIDGNNYYGTGISGDSEGWALYTYDLKNVYILGNVTGKPQVWIGVWFISDLSYNGYEAGAWVDDISLYTCNSSIGCLGYDLLSAANPISSNLREESVSISIPNGDFAPESQPSTTLDVPWFDLTDFITDFK